MTKSPVRHLDTILLADTILAPHVTQGSITAIGLSDGRIVALGSREDAEGWPVPTEATHDFGAATITAGFVDAHTHVISGVETVMGVDLISARTVEEIAALVAAYAQSLPEGAWVRGFNLNLNAFPNALPTRFPLEEAFGGRPGDLLLTDHHALLANGEALRLADIQEPRDFEGNARIVGDDSGRVTGYLIELPATRLIDAVRPEVGFAQKVAAVGQLLDDLARTGVTGVHVLNWTSDTPAVLRALEEVRDLPVRVRIFPMWEPDASLESYDAFVGLQGMSGRRWEVDGVKLVVDGTIDNGTAWLHEPDTCGEGLRSYWVAPEDFVGLVHRLMADGIRTTTHAIGDRGVEFVLDTIAAAPASLRTHTHRIEHVETIPDETLERFVDLGVVASMQPLHVAHTKADESDNWSRRLGPVRAAHGFRMGDLVKAGASVTLGSDWPIDDYDARVIYAMAQTRRRPGTTDEPVRPHLALSREQALHAYTAAVWASVDFPDEGVIGEGAIADLTVFADNPLTTEPEIFATTQVLATFVDGRRVSHGSL